MKSIDSLKMIIMTEFYYEGGPHGYHWYYIKCSDKMEELMEPFNDVFYNTAENCSWDPKDSSKADVYDAEELQKIYSSIEATPEFLKNTSFDNGSCGFECECYAEGKNIVPALVKFYNDVIMNMWWKFDDEADELEQERQILMRAEKDLENIQRIQETVDMVAENLLNNNDLQF